MKWHLEAQRYILVNMKNKMTSLFLITLSIFIFVFSSNIFESRIALTVEMGTIVVVKDAIPNDPQDFAFRNNWSQGDAVEYYLDDDGDETNLPQFNLFPSSKSFQVIARSGYGVIEINQDVPERFGWKLVGVVCTGEGNADHTNFTVRAGETVTCTFTNIKNPGRIEIEKQTAPAGHLQAFEFTGEINASLSDDGVVGKYVPAGQYTVSETALSGWILNSIVCNDGNSSGAGNTATFNVESDETVRCVFNNSEDASQMGQIVVKKETNPNGDTTQFEFDPSWLENNFLLQDNGTPHNSGYLTPGIYSVSEINISANWELTLATCDDGSPINAINLSVGEIITCTFTNSLITSVVQGCSPGYWKQEQHFDSYMIYSPSTLFADTGFENAFPEQTLLDVLNANGGGLVALGRIMAAALLNAAAIPGYPGAPADVVAAFNSTHEGTKNEYNILKAHYETLQDPCPLN